MMYKKLAKNWGLSVDRTRDLSQVGLGTLSENHTTRPIVHLIDLFSKFAKYCLLIDEMPESSAARLS